MSNLTTINGSQLNTINNYVNWLFKKKEDFVVLKRFENKALGVTKMFIALPVRERVFEKPKMDLFTPDSLNTPAFPYRLSEIKTVKTLYSGNIFEFTDIELLLTSFGFTKRIPSVNHAHYSNTEYYKIFKDYTRTKQEQEDAFTLITSFLNPEQSVDSIYRLLHTKYVTIIDITFDNTKAK